MTEQKASEQKTYHGNCHCGAFQFNVTTAPIERVSECNCSNCSKNGALWVPRIGKDDFVVARGDGTLREYMMNPEERNISLLFCPTCGSTIKEERKKDGSPVPNIRCFSNIDINALEIYHVNNAKALPLYQPPQLPDSLQDFNAEAGMKVYHGSCHCKSVIYSLKSKSLEEIEVISCNCSLCSRNSDLWIYSKKENVKIHGKENLTGYEFLHKDSLHSFCKICGVSVLVEVTEPGSNIVPINVRTINGIDLGSLRLKKYDGKANDPQYIVH